MWTVIKFDEKKIEFLKKDFKKRLGADFKIYIPKFSIQKYRSLHYMVFAVFRQNFKKN